MVHGVVATQILLNPTIAKPVVLTYTVTQKAVKCCLLVCNHRHKLRWCIVTVTVTVR